MKRKPMSKGEWALLLFPLLILVAFFWLPFDRIRDEWLIRKHKTSPTWSALAWSPDSRFIALAGGFHIPAPRDPNLKPGQPPAPPLLSRGDLELYDVQGTLMRRFVGHKSTVWRVAFSPDGKQLMGSNVGGFRVWDVSTGRRILTIEAPYSTVQWSKDGKTIEGKSFHGVRQSISRATPYLPEYFRVTLATGAITSTGPPQQLVTLSNPKSQSGLIAIRRPLQSQRTLHQSSGETIQLQSGGEVDIISADGQRVLTMYGQTVGDMAWRGDHTLVRLCPIEGGYHVLGLVLMTANARTRTQKAHELVLVPFAKPIPTPTRSSGQTTYHNFYQIDNDTPSDGRLSIDGRRAAVWSRKTLWLLDVASATAVASWPITQSGLYADRCQFSPDGKLLAWIDGRNLRVVDATTGE